MKELNLSAVIAAKRREKGITQEEIAAYIGVSKASVSKWETGQSYPDITFLPMLAAYFDISIDQLMGYSPQIEKKDIEKMYQKLSEDFASKHFEEIIIECEAEIKKYFSCYPFILRMAQLFINHASMAASQERRKEILIRVVQLCERITSNCKDMNLVQEATFMQAMSWLSMGDGKAVLELLGETPHKAVSDGVLISRAFLLMGNAEKSKEILQVELYQNLMNIFGELLELLQMNIECLDIAEKIYYRAESIAEIFQMEKLNPNNMALLYILGAQMYQSGGFQDKAIELLSKYVDVCIHGFFPVALHGDDFFDRIDSWLSEYSETVPRSEAVIKESMMKDVLQSPMFEGLWEHSKYIKIVQKLKVFMGGN